MLAYDTPPPPDSTEDEEQGDADCDEGSGRPGMGDGMGAAADGSSRMSRTGWLIGKLCPWCSRAGQGYAPQVALPPAAEEGHPSAPEPPAALNACHGAAAAADGAPHHHQAHSDGASHMADSTSSQLNGPTHALRTEDGSCCACGGGGGSRLRRGTPRCRRLAARCWRRVSPAMSVLTFVVSIDNLVDGVGMLQQLDTSAEHGYPAAAYYVTFAVAIFLGGAVTAGVRRIPSEGVQSAWFAFGAVSLLDGGLELANHGLTNWVMLGFMAIWGLLLVG